MSTQRAERVPTLTLGWRLKMALGNGSAQDMADYLGVSRQTLSRWMADKGTPPKKAFLHQWALRAGVDVDWLETGKAHEDAPPPPGDERPAKGSKTLAELTEAKRARTRGRSTGRYFAAAA